GLHSQHGPRAAGQPRAEQQLWVRRPKRVAGGQQILLLTGACPGGLLKKGVRPLADGLIVGIVRRGLTPFSTGHLPLLPGVAALIWLWIALGVVLFLLLSAALVLTGFFIYVVRRFQDNLVRIFQEKPLFIIPRGQPVSDAEDVHFRTPDGLALRGCYLK